MPKPKPYQVIAPDGKIISVESYMETDDYNKKIQQQIDDFLTDKKEKELIALFSNKTQGKKKVKRFINAEDIAVFCSKQIYHYEKERKKISDIEVGMVDAYKSVIARIESLR